MKRSIISRSLSSIMVAVGLVALLPQISPAAPIFSDNFNTETLSTNYTGFANWAVTDGSVDVIGQGFFDLLPGNGRYVDLDGSSGNAGTMTSSALALSGGTQYTLSFSLAGSQRGDTNTVSYGIDLNSDNTLEHFGSQTLAGSDAFNPFTLAFTPTSGTSTARIVFNHEGGDDTGLLLDNVALSAVPLPGAFILFGMGMAGLAAWKRMQQG